jgi:hypothetical protein
MRPGFIAYSAVLSYVFLMHACNVLLTATPVPFEPLPPRLTLNHPVRRSQTGTQPPRIYTPPTCPAAFIIANHRSEHNVCDATSEPRARGRDHHRLDSARSAGRCASPPRHASISEPRGVTCIARASAIDGACVRGF